MKPLFRPALLATCVLAAGCSSIEVEGTKIDYRSASKAPSLEVPPDLSQLTRDTRYAVPGVAVTATGQQANRPTVQATAPSQFGDVRIERSGTQRWLVVDRPADQVMPAVREFWKENGFTLTLDQPELGLVETDWAENRAKLPQDMVRNLLGKVFDSLYSTSERDRFRTRLERASTDRTEVFVSHRGMQEVYTSTRQDQTVWQPRPSDPELENEFLRRLMLKLGGTAQQAQAAANLAPPLARAAQADNQPVVLLEDAFDRAWRRVGLSLDRSGFTVEDRDRSKGIYFVRYVEPNADKQEKAGFFDKFFSGVGRAAPPVKYRIVLTAQGTGTVVAVQNAEGQPETSATAQRIVKLLADDLK
jgi:outer membrane protein assembly factor BamC